MSETDYQKHLQRNCFFCKLIWEREFRQKEDYRIVDWEDDKPYFVILSERPKITGHLLIVSKKPHDDITDLEEESEGIVSFLRAVIKWSKRIKERLRAEKVYVMSMCDHWELDELPKGVKETTEHLHFHLLPRYKANRPERGDRFFTRPEEAGFESRPFVLEKIKDYLKFRKGM